MQHAPKNLARQIGAKVVMLCTPEAANRHSGYLVGGTSPFATRRSRFCRSKHKRQSAPCMISAKV